MALPIVNTPTYELKVPSTGKPVKFRPFLVREEKALLIAQQSEDMDTMVATLKDVIRACTQGKVDVEELAIFDLEYILTQIRAKSVGEQVELTFACGACNDPKGKRNIIIDLTAIDVIRNPEHTNKIKLTDTFGVIMKYPSVSALKVFDDETKTDVEQVFEIMCQCIDVIYMDDELFYAKEHTKQEIEEFINNLTQTQFEDIKKFFDTMPKLSKNVTYDCPACGHKNVVELEGLANFF